ncbi:MAG: fused MFS/spermidine synthase [Rubrivivax sp.]|nr:fused MFS/spermidine synthase [Pyrinomonadaceae bacterium]
MSTLFAVTLFLSAFLLFWVQPLVGKMVLPLLGGTPAVWNTCMLFFQGVLLAGYAYVLASTRWLSTRAQILLHAALLVAAALAFPIAISESAAGGHPEGGSPVGWLLTTLLLTTGLPFFALSASAPLLQKWFSQTSSASASDPYFLYAASNAGSLIALLGFPVLLEPNLALCEQSRTLAFAYGALVALVLACAAVAWRSRSMEHSVVADAVGAGTSPAPTAPPLQEVSPEHLTMRQRLRWTLLAFVPSSLVLGATTYITTDVVAAPLLWVIPLSLYLLSFVLVFARRQIVPRWLAARLLPGVATLLVLIYLSGATQPVWFLIFFHLAFLFIAAMVCHGQLADERPAARHLAEFYLCLSVGGALGGLFNALVAPLVFNSVVEYPLVILLASYLRPAFRRGGRNLLGIKLRGRADEDDSVAEEDEPRAMRLDLLMPLAIFALTAVLALLASRFGIGGVNRIALALGIPLFLLNHFYAPRPLRFALGLAAVMLASVVFAESSGQTLHASRNFFGTLRVTADSSGELRWLRHGSTLHGSQHTDPARACQPLSYYHREGPLGSVFDAFDAKPDAAQSVAVVGLGAGTTATYARAGQAWTFYEIDPAVVDVARDPSLFTYLSACAGAPVGVVLGDARLRLRDAPPGGYGLIVLDAFSSDAVPAHLMTREALALYLAKLAPGGLVAFHVSNRSLELERVVGGLARDAGLVARVFADREHKPETGKDPSTWVVVARADSDLGALLGDARWQPLDGSTRKLVLWRDDFSNVVSVFKWL